MLNRLRSARLLWPTVFTIAGVALMLGLGQWQLDRKAWKEGLIAQISERAHAPPVDIAEAETRAQQGDAEYLRVVARGVFAHADELHFYAPDPKLGPGFHIYTPLRLANGRAVFVNRGYAPEALEQSVKREAGLPLGEVTVTGLVRMPRAANSFTPSNNPEANRWFWPDLAAMTRAAFKGETAPSVPPFFIDADAEPGRTSWPRGGTTRLDIPNRHLEYALTWFGLAATLAAVYAAFALERLRRSSR